MATVATPYGTRAIQAIGGRPFSGGAIREYKVAANNPPLSQPRLSVKFLPPRPLYPLQASLVFVSVQIMCRLKVSRLSISSSPQTSSLAAALRFL